MALNKRKRDDNALYYENETVPQNTTKSSPALRTGEGGQLGVTKILFEVDSDITIADTQSITLIVQESDDGSTGWLTISSKQITSSGATTYAEADELHEYNLTRKAKEFTRVQVTTTDAAATGEIAAYCSSAAGVGRF